MLTFEPTRLDGVVQFQKRPAKDDRGSFARLYCPESFADAGVDFTAVQMNLSSNVMSLTLRGMHYQNTPYAEAKVVQVSAGAIYDVVVDIRPNSPTFMQWQGFELSRENGQGLFVPEGCAHGFLTLCDSTDVLYLMGRIYVPGHAAGFRYDDPAFGIEWPSEPDVISEADLNWPAFSV